MTPAVLPGTLSVAIVEDRATIRKGITLFLDASPGFRCGGSYGTMEAALPRILEEPPDVVLVDLVLPQMSGTDGIRRISQVHRGLPMLVFTVFEDDERVFEALCAGACGCLSKKTPPGELLVTLRVVAAGGGGPMSPECARRALELLQAETTRVEPAPPAVGVARLLEHLAQGHNVRTAACEMGISSTQAGTMMRTIYEALHARQARDRNPSG